MADGGLIKAPGGVGKGGGGGGNFYSRQPDNIGRKANNHVTANAWDGTERRSGRDRRLEQALRGPMIDSRNRQDRRRRKFTAKA